jgi:dodecin
MTPPDSGIIGWKGPPDGTPDRKALAMAHTYGITEVVGSSTTSIDDAITTAVTRASTTVRGLDWFEVTEIRGHLADGAVAHYQVGLKLGFRLEE